ncbi:hypothetical protein BD289DRAFT_372501 [Coniella lustricola]|uniref:polynucleotide adenylyltransferase n=1 Tax=Coniella lustricola TaxID=2025994 RepID=A0A2T3A2A8_9PEZI|nr:hypothetical protein BD289DRAFT_372501 [Coniella lustricola]
MEGQRQGASRYSGLPPPPPPPSGSNSYRPPPPPSSSLPPRPPSSNNYDSYQNDRHGDRDRDSRYSRRDRDDRYQSSSYDNYRSLPPRPQDSYRDSRSNGGDSFRPPQGDFSFRSDKPSGVSDSYRPSGSSSNSPRGAPRGPARNSQQDRRSGPRGYRGRGGGHFEPRRAWKPFRPAERAILQGNNSALPAEDFADTENGVTYRDIDQLSDSDEAAMDTSDSENESGEPASKRARTVARNKTEDNTPKWSNPDPYDALPPIEESEKKRKDMVQLIRKARVEPTTNGRAALAAPTEDEDFIRCDSDSDDAATKDQDDEEVFIDPLTYNRGGASTQEAAPSPVIKQAAPPLADRVTTAAPPAAPKSSAPPGLPELASRKRTHDDILKLPDHARLKPVQRQPLGGALVQEWRSRSGEVPCPWVQPLTSKVAVNVRFHMEVCDFYNHVKPCDFEERLRSKLVEDLNDFIDRNTNWKDWQMYPFGSFMSGLYLPTGDMDLAFCSRAFVNGGLPRPPSESQLRALVKVFRKSPLAVHRHIEPVLKARVPLIKYVDNVTGLKIDISFENNSGLIAVNTFKKWKEQWPVMPVLVTIIKQYLLMRGLNEPVNGGIGGFSVICMVVSMLQMMPAVQSGDMVPEHNLGALLVHFFDLYGNRHNYEVTALRLNPPGYVNKNRVKDLTYRNPKRLSIIDPNNPANDIAGGSSNYPQIAACFREARRLLQDRLHRIASGEPHDSILSVILGGNYATFREQRLHLYKLHDKVFGFDDN